MGIFSRDNATDTPISGKNLEASAQKKDFYLLTISTLFNYMKSFSFDLDEINADHFKEQLSRLSQQFEHEENIKKISRHFESNQAEITAFIDREREYFFNKDLEFKDIIKILTTGLSTVNTENQRFNTLLETENLKLEEITHLDDIRKMKAALSEKVSALKKSIQRKQEQDAEHLETLSSKVETLKVELEETKNASLTDGLTGAFNRLAFDTQMKKRVIESRRSFSLMILDIDNFKLINDSYGHPVGDRVLIALVQKCKNLIRKEDIFARYGGEEFVIISPGTSLRNTLKKGKQLCTAIAKAEYAVEGEGNEKVPLSFTVSIGVSTRRQSDTVASIISRADKALYKAKHLGKNRVVSEKEID